MGIKEVLRLPDLEPREEAFLKNNFNGSDEENFRSAVKKLCESREAVYKMANEICSGSEQIRQYQLPIEELAYSKKYVKQLATKVDAEKILQEFPKEIQQYILKL